MVTTNNSSLTRKPFVTVLQEWLSSTELPKSSNKAFQQLQLLDNDGKQLAEEITLEELEKEMSELASPQEKFIFACRRGDDKNSCELLKQLFAQFPSLNMTKVVDKTVSNCTLMHLLAQKNKTRCMEFLAGKAPALIDATDSIASTPLLHAVAHSCEDAVAFLLSTGKVNLNAKDIYNKFPLLMAMRNKHFKIAEMLITNNRTLDVHLRGTKGNTVLHSMIDEGDLRSVQFLVEKCGASPQRRNNDEENALYYALPHIEIAQYLANQFSKNGLAKMIINVNTYGKNLLHKAASDGFFDSLLLILGSLNLGELSQSQVQSLLNSVDKFGDTSLILAVKNGRRDVVKFLCQCLETNINDGDRESNTPLQHAITGKDKEIIDMLTGIGASLKATNKHDDGNQKARVGCGQFLKSLHTLLVAMLIIVAVSCIITIAAISIGFFTSNISSEARRIREKSFAEVMDYLTNSLKEHDTLFRTAASQMEFDITNVNSSLQFTYTIFQANLKKADLITASFMALDNGALVGILVDTTMPNGGQLFESYTDPHNVSFYSVEDVSVPWHEARDPTRMTTAVSSDEELDNVYLKVARAANGTAWTPSYVNGNTGFASFLYITLVLPVRDPVTNAFIGMFGLDASTESINPFIREKAHEDGSVIVIVEGGTGNLIGASDPNVPLYGQNGNNVVRYDGEQGQNKRISQMLKYARKTYGGHSLSKIGKKNVFDSFGIGGRRHAINIGHVEDEYGMSWIVLQSLPMDTFYKQFYISLGVMLAVTFLLLLLSLIVAFVAARIFMNPIQTLIQQADDIKMLQFEKVEKQLSEKSSVFTEVKVLQQSFKSMVQRLKQFRSFIPDHILAVIEAEVNTSGASQQPTIETTKRENAHLAAVQESTSSSLSDSRTSSVSHRLNNKGMINRALKSTLTSGSVTIMTIRFPDMVDILELYNAADISETTKDMLSAIRDCVRDSNGQFVSTSARKSVIVWNSFISQHDHRVRACKAANNCMDRLKALSVKWAQNHLPVLNITIGICSGTVYFGNLGADSTKFFTVIGRPAKLSDHLCHKNKYWGTSMIVSQDIYEAAKDEFFMRPIDRIDSEGDSHSFMYELGAAMNPEDWVNELDKSKSKNKWANFIEAHNLLQQEMYSEALRLFSAHVELNPYDVLAQKMVELCNENLSAISSNPRTEPEF